MAASKLLLVKYLSDKSSAISVCPTHPAESHRKEQEQASEVRSHASRLCRWQTPPVRNLAICQGLELCVYTRKHSGNVLGLLV